MSRDLLSWAGGLLLAVVLLAVVWLHGDNHGTQVERAKALAAENARMTAVSLAVGETVARSNALSIEVERLRARPERVRTITREIRVEADADCRSLPADWLRLWNAEPGDRSDAGTALVDDAGRMPVAAH